MMPRYKMDMTGTHCRFSMDTDFMHKIEALGAILIAYFEGSWMTNIFPNHISINTTVKIGTIIQIIIVREYLSSMQG